MKKLGTPIGAGPGRENEKVGLLGVGTPPLVAGGGGFGDVVAVVVVVLLFFLEGFGLGAGFFWCVVVGPDEEDF